MQFHDYENAYTRWRIDRVLHGILERHHVTTAAKFREELIRYHEHCPDHSLSKATEHERQIIIDCRAEAQWVRNRRPYYNLWPSVLPLIDRLDLSRIKLSDLHLRQQSAILLRWPVQHLPREPAWCRVAWARNHAGTLYLQMAWQYTDTRHEVTVFYTPVSDELLLSIPTTTRDLYGRGVRDTYYDQEPAIRAIAFVSLLDTDAGLIEPAVLAKDRVEYDQSTDDQRRKQLEERAVGKTDTRGFDVGRVLHQQTERGEVSPHYRNGCLAVYHTGKGRAVPVIRWRKGSIVNRQKLTEVPTGFLGSNEATDVPTGE